MYKATDDITVMKNQVKAMKNLIEEYELIKAKKHPHFRFASDLFLKRGIKKQNFSSIIIGLRIYEKINPYCRASEVPKTLTNIYRHS